MALPFNTQHSTLNIQHLPSWREKPHSLPPPAHPGADAPPRPAPPAPRPSILDTSAGIDDSRGMALAEVAPMRSAPLLSLIIPLFNEEENVEPLIAEVEAALPLLPVPV